MKKEFKSMFVIGNVVCLLLFNACGGKDSSKSSKKEKAENDNAVSYTHLPMPTKR